MGSCGPLGRRGKLPPFSETKETKDAKFCPCLEYDFFLPPPPNPGNLAPEEAGRKAPPA